MLLGAGPLFLLFCVLVFPVSAVKGKRTDLCSCWCLLLGVSTLACLL